MVPEDLTQRRERAGRALEYYWEAMREWWLHELSLGIAAKKSGRTLESVRKEIEGDERTKR